MTRAEELDHWGWVADSVTRVQDESARAKLENLLAAWMERIVYPPVLVFNEDRPLPKVGCSQ